MPDPFVIRRAHGPDLASIIELRIEFERITRDSGSLDEGARRTQLSALLGPDLESGRLRCWMAEIFGCAVAQAALRLRRGAGSGEILNAFTEPAFRGRGIGSALVAAAIAEARRLGLASLILQPTEDSRRIYERMGFRADRGRMLLELTARRP
jgi:GNAT superfamily N-acetyltransferase